MPKVVDHHARRREIAEAVWRVIRRDGLEAASVRNVAAEAGLSAGAMRHYFDGHQALQAGAMTAMVDRIAERITEAGRASGTVRERAERVLHEVLPLDDQRQAESEVWFAFVAEARVDEAFRPVAEATYDRLRSLMADLIDALLPTHSADDKLLETERLFAVVDGLVLHAVQRPGALSPALMRKVVDRHLAQLID